MAYGIEWGVSCNERDRELLSKMTVGTRNDTQSGDSPFHPWLSCLMFKVKLSVFLSPEYCSAPNARWMTAKDECSFCVQV